MSDESDDISLSDYLAQFSDPEARARAWREAGCPLIDGHDSVTSIFWNETLGPQSALAAGLSNHDFKEYEREFQVKNLRKQNRARKRVWKNEYMTSKQAKSLHQAISFCNFEKAKLLNAKLTITWQDFGVENPRESVEAHGKLQNEMGMRLSDWGHEHLYIYVHEHTRDLGFHSHVMLHVERDCARDLRDWLKTYFVSNFPPTPITAYKFEPRYTGKKSRHLPWDDSLIQRQWSGYRYIIKSLNPWIFIRDEQRKRTFLYEILKLRKLVKSLPLEGVQRCGGAHALWTAAQRRRWFPRVFHEHRWEDLYTGWELIDGNKLKAGREMELALEAMQM